MTLLLALVIDSALSMDFLFKIQQLISFMYGFFICSIFFLQFYMTRTLLKKL